MVGGEYMEYINAFSLNADKDDASFDCDVLVSRKIDGELAQRKKELDVVIALII